MELNIYTELYCIRSDIKVSNMVSLNYNKNKQHEPETHQNSAAVSPEILIEFVC